jgi:hypothetical protein
MSWKPPFDEPITLPGGRQLVTLEDAGDHITKLPKADQQLDEWQTLIGAAEGRDFMMHARIGMMRAIKPGLFRRLDAGIDRRSCHATIVAIRPPGGCTPSVLGLGAAVPRSCFLQERFPVSCLN